MEANLTSKQMVQVDQIRRQQPRKQQPKVETVWYKITQEDYDEDLATIKYLKKKPTSFFIIGRPGTWKTKVAKRLAMVWKCIYVSPDSLITEAMSSTDTKEGKKIRNALYMGEAIPERMIFYLLQKRLQQPDVRHLGYVMEGFPSLMEEALSYKDQMKLIFDIPNKPDVLIYIKISERDLILRRTGQWINFQKGEIYPAFFIKQMGIMGKGDTKFQKGREEEEEEEEDDDDEEASEVQHPPTEKIEPDFLPLSEPETWLLVKREEDSELLVKEEIQLFTENHLKYLEDAIASHDKQYYIELDGNKLPSEMTKDLLDRLGTLALTKAKPPMPLWSPDDAELGLSAAESVREYAKRDVIGIRYRWRKSRWNISCPVALQEGFIEDGVPEFAVAFLDRIYFLSTAERFHKFLMNPRPYLLPPMPIPPCKIIVTGMPLSGRSGVAHALAEKFCGKVIDVNEILHEEIQTGKRRAVAATLDFIAETVIHKVDQKQADEWARAEEQRKTKLNQWMTMPVTSLWNMITKNREKTAKETGQVTATPRSSKTSMDLHEFNPDQLKEDEEWQDFEVEELDQETKMLVTVTRRRKVKRRPPPPPEIAEPLPPPEPVTRDHPEVKKAIDEAYEAALHETFILPPEVYVSKLKESIDSIEEKRQKKFPKYGRHGGWVIDNLPVSEKVWKKLAANNIIPDDAVYLRDTSDEYKYLVKRWLALHGNEMQATEMAKPVGLDDKEERSPPISQKFMYFQARIAENEKDWLQMLRLLNVNSREYAISDASSSELAETIYNDLMDMFRYKAKIYDEDDQMEELEEESDEPINYVPPVEEEEEEEAEDEEMPQDDWIQKNMGNTRQYCPVTLKEKYVLKTGKFDFIAKYREKMYYCMTEEALLRFALEPRKYVSESEPPKPPPLRICLLGPLGSGKSTLGRMCPDIYGIFYVDFSERLQELILPILKKKIGPNYNLLLEEEQEKQPEFVFEDNDEGDITMKILEDEDILSKAKKPVQIRLSQAEKAIHSYIMEGVSLPASVLDIVVKVLWEKEPYRSTGFILDGFPRSEEEWEYMTENLLFPDAFIVLEASEAHVLSNILANKGKKWKEMQAERKITKEKDDEKLMMEREEAVAERRRFLEEERKVMEEERKVREEEERMMEEEEKELSEEDFGGGRVEFENIEVILEDEFPPLELEEIDWESETDASVRLKDQIMDRYALDTSKIEVLKLFVMDEKILWCDVNAERIPHIVAYLFHCKIKEIIKNRQSIFERAYFVSVARAQDLLDQGYMFLSKFGSWCPVHVSVVTCTKEEVSSSLVLMEKDTVLNPFVSKGSKIFPVVHRHFIYFVAGEEARNKFCQHPLKYISQEVAKPIVPMRLAIIGPPKSGKTNLAQHFMTKYAVVKLSLGDCIRSVLERQTLSCLGEEIKTILQKGETVPQELAFQTVESALIDMKCQMRGFVFDGFPLTKEHINLMERRFIIPTQVFYLDVSREEIDMRADIDRRNHPSYPPINDSQEILDFRVESWENNLAQVKEWYQRERQNLAVIDTSHSKWWLWNTISEKVKKSLENIQNFLHNVKSGKAACLKDLCLTPAEFDKKKSVYLNYCPVCLNMKEKLVDCTDDLNLALTAEYKENYYKLCNEEHLKMFLENPESITPPNCLHIQLPYHLPKKVSFQEAESWAFPVEFKGYCPVTYVDGCYRYKALIFGSPSHAASYMDKLYHMRDFDCLEKFMRDPKKYSDLKVPEKLPPPVQPFQVIGLPIMGYLEQTCAAGLCKALTAVGIYKPKHPFLSITRSALLFVAYHLKAFNDKQPEYTITKYRDVLNEFKRRCELVETVSKGMDACKATSKPVPEELQLQLSALLSLEKGDNISHPNLYNTWRASSVFSVWKDPKDQYIVPNM